MVKINVVIPEEGVRKMTIEEILSVLKDHAKNITKDNSPERKHYVLGVINGIMGLLNDRYDKKRITKDEYADAMNELMEFSDGL